MVSALLATYFQAAQPPHLQGKAPFFQNFALLFQPQILGTLCDISLARESRQHRACLFALTGNDPAGYDLLLVQPILSMNVLELWKGDACYDGSLERLTAPQNLQAAF